MPEVRGSSEKSASRVDCFSGSTFVGADLTGFFGSGLAVGLAEEAGGLAGSAFFGTEFQKKRKGMVVPSGVDSSFMEAQKSSTSALSVAV